VTVKVSVTDEGKAEGNLLIQRILENGRQNSGSGGGVDGIAKLSSYYLAPSLQWL